MNKDSLRGIMEGLRMHVGVSLRAVAAIPPAKLDSNPVANMRTPKELAVHAFAYMRGIPKGILKGKLTAEECVEPFDQIKSLDQLLTWCQESWNSMEADFEKFTDAQLAAMVETYWGPTFPGYVLIPIVYDEHLHHRGQLYTYLRSMGAEPPFLWSFEENAPAYQPKAMKA